MCSEGDVVTAMNRSDIPADAGRSWWLRDALVDDPRPAPPLRGDVIKRRRDPGAGLDVDGAGDHEPDPGIDVVLLEQDIAGGGASGRNGS